MIIEKFNSKVDELKARALAAKGKLGPEWRSLMFSFYPKYQQSYEMGNKLHLVGHARQADEEITVDMEALAVKLEAAQYKEGFSK